MRIISLTISSAALLFLGTACGADVKESPISGPWDQWAENNPSWVTPYPPHKIIDNIHFVGTEGIGSYLITSPDGHILLDGGMPQNAPMILKSVEALGFDPEDIRYLINSHAHFDHSGGLAEIKEKTGALMIASEGDRSALEGGFYLGFEDNPELSSPPVAVDGIIRDGETLSVGTATLTAHITPGHSRGCTSWKMDANKDGVIYDVIFFCSASVAGNSLEPEQYPGIIEDYRETFQKTRGWTPDIALSNHPNFLFGQLEKSKRHLAGESDAFFDPETFGRTMAKLEQDFGKRLAKAQNQEDGQE